MERGAALTGGCPGSPAPVPAGFMLPPPRPWQRGKGRRTETGTDLPVRVGHGLLQALEVAQQAVLQLREHLLRVCLLQRARGVRQREENTGTGWGEAWLPSPNPGAPGAQGKPSPSQQSSLSHRLIVGLGGAPGAAYQQQVPDLVLGLVAGGPHVLHGLGKGSRGGGEHRGGL